MALTRNTVVALVAVGQLAAELEPIGNFVEEETVGVVAVVHRPAVLGALAAFVALVAAAFVALAVFVALAAFVALVASGNLAALGKPVALGVPAVLGHLVALEALDEMKKGHWVGPC